MSKYHMYLVTLVALISFHLGYSLTIDNSRRNYIKSISISDDGKIIAWDIYKSICISKTQEPQKYISYSTEGFGEHGANYVTLSKNGDEVYFISDEKIFYSKLSGIKMDGAIQLSREVQQFRYIDIAPSSNAFITQLMDNPKFRKSKCSPRWVTPLIYNRDENGNWRQGSTIFEINECDQSNDYFLFQKDEFLFTKHSGDRFSHNIFVAHEKQNNIWDQNKLSFVGYQFKTISKDGKVMILCKRVPDENGRKKITPYYCERNGKNWSTPKLLIERHKYSIGWNIRISPDKKHIAWSHIVRDIEKKTIIKWEIKVIKRKGQKWTEPVKILEVPDNMQVNNLEISNRNLIFSTYRNHETVNDEVRTKGKSCAQRNRLFYYSSLDNNGILKEIFQEECVDYRKVIKRHIYNSKLRKLQ